MEHPESDPGEADLRRYYAADRELVRRAVDRALMDDAALAQPLRRGWSLGRGLAAAAAAVLVAAAWLGWTWHQGLRPHYAWEGGTAQGRLGLGEWLEVAGAEVTRLSIGDVGEIQLDPGSRLCAQTIADDRHELYLERGGLQARIWAPARVFQVGTPAGLAVDLGCIYRLRVDRAGTTELEVTSGRVSFELEGVRSLVPAGARCRAWPGRGLSAPVFADAPEEIQALASVALSELGGAAAWASALAAARPRDSLSLWHLLQARDAELRGAAEERLAAFAPAPTPPTANAWRAALEPLWAVDGGGK